MTALVLENTWYQGGVPKETITKIEIRNSLTGSATEYWDASESQDGSIMCYRNGTEVTIVCDGIASIGDKAFSKFLALQSISGLSSVTTIGESAFCYTPNLVSVDIAPANLTSIGASAFRMSSVEDTLDLSSVSLDIIGEMGTRHKRWNNTSLDAVRNVTFPKTIYLDVPNPDSQDNYLDVPFGIKDGITYYADSGCTSFACYHIWNCLNAGTDKEYGNWFEWYNSTINADGIFAENNGMNSQTEPTMFEKLGWTDSGSTYIKDETQLQAIIDNLMNGVPTYVVMHSTNFTNTTHAVVIIGCNANTHKLALIDSRVIRPTGIVSWVAFEDVFVEGDVESDRMRILDYNQPMLAPNCTWFSQGGTSVTRASITEIDIKDSYIPSGDITSSWDASAAQDGSITAYVEGTKLTLVGNGSGKILMNPDSSYVFSSSNSDRFSNLVMINGANLLSAVRATTFERLFYLCKKLVSVDTNNWNTQNVVSMSGVFNQAMALEQANVENWNTSSCTNMSYMFQLTLGLSTLKLNKWDVSNVETMLSMFQGHSSVGDMNITSIDVSNWNTASCTNMSGIFQRCSSLVELDVSKWDTSSCTTLAYIFRNCGSLQELDLSNWDTSSCSDMYYMMNGMNKLQKVTIGEKFSFGGDGVTPANACSIPTPSADYIDGADGNWYDVNGNAHAPSSVPDKIHGVWYASPSVMEEDAERMVFVKNGSLLRTGEAIRTNTETTKGYLPSEFADAVDLIKAASAELNFAVVGGTSEPVNPVENTIWINTDIEITDWEFSVAEPTGVEGRVWIRTGISSTSEFNALKSNSLNVYPLSVKQYISGAWTTKTVKTYQNNAWVEWWTGVLFDYGNTYSYVTGGYNNIALTNSSGYEASPAKITEQSDGSWIIESSNDNDSAMIHTVNKIDLTGFTALNMNGILWDYNGWSMCKLGVWSDIGANTSENLVASISNINSVQDFSIDISALTGEYYIGFCIYGHSNYVSITLNKLWLTSDE